MRLRRMIGAMAMFLAVAFVGVASLPAQHADAAFTDAEHASGQLATVVLQSPVIVSTQCTRPSLLTLGQPFLTVTWRWPQTGEPYAAFAPQNVRWRINESVAQPQTSGPVNGVYTTRFTGNLLEQLLGSITDLLLGSNFTVSARTVWTPGTAEWQANQAKSIPVRIPPLTGITCPNPDA